MCEEEKRYSMKSLLFLSIRANNKPKLEESFSGKVILTDRITHQPSNAQQPTRFQIRFTNHYRTNINAMILSMIFATVLCLGVHSKGTNKLSGLGYKMRPNVRT